MNASVWIVNLAVLATVLHADLGYKKIGWLRLARPILLAIAVVPIFAKNIATHGNGLTLEIIGATAGLLLGLLAAALLKVRHDQDHNAAYSTGRAPYAALWGLVIGARLLFAYASVHVFPAQLGHWMLTNRITGDALTDTLIFMAMGMLVSRTAALLAKGTRATHAHLTRTATAPAQLHNAA
ncbi:hypothetical protein AV521_36935 [Streptomyces sp. IMTB 2501]|uniref:hypothetical protein n=1 Tax=Streptomyces sp. IMTB 2501 TaxID=1776340 RepID=UPI00096D4913|nr:hypothetical protein [Streptomyces sp. IMTB 2501]OLZ64109.1 hypothetical protein AV521_36935 [Streptomyces sp. IMTB 2501]